MTEQIDCKSGPEMEATAKRIAAERGLKMRTHRGHGGGFSPKGPSIGLYDGHDRELVRVWFRCYFQA